MTISEEDRGTLTVSAAWEIVGVLPGFAPMDENPGIDRHGAAQYGELLTNGSALGEDLEAVLRGHLSKLGILEQVFLTTRIYPGDQQTVVVARAEMVQVPYGSPLYASDTNGADAEVIDLNDVLESLQAKRQEQTQMEDNDV